MDFDDDFRFEKDGPVRRIILNRPRSTTPVGVDAEAAARGDPGCPLRCGGSRADHQWRRHTFCAGDDIAEFPC